MAGSVNKCILVGNIGRDPEIRNTQNGSKIANLALATSDTWKDKNSGERKEKTEWHKVTIFNDRLVDVVERFVKKGSKLYIEGVLRTRKYEKNGQEHYTTEVVLENFRGELVLLDSAGGNGNGNGGSRSDNRSSGGSGGGGRTGQSGGGGAGRGGPAHDDLDDEIPF